MASNKEPRTSASREVCPWTHALTFRDSKLEEEFRQAVASPATSADVEALFGALVLLAIPIKHVVAMQGQPTSLPAIVAVPLALTLIAKCFRKSIAAGTSRWRFVLVMICLSIYFMELATLQTVGKFWLAVHVVNRSCLVSLALGGSGYRPFPVHMVIQLLGTCLSAVWTSGICTPSQATPSLHNTLNALGFAMESILTRFSTLGFPLDFTLSPGKYPCLLVVAFLHAWSGVIAPLAVHYCWEVKKRSAYLERVGRFPPMAQSLKEFVNGSLILGAVVFLVATQIIWFGFSTAAELFRKRGELWCEEI
ncbi:hypothetical protein BSKO_07141 [Bryopsis sp. KO-2023]|nr:hypothetical protein BSKO_07141 [Bryopsis sp. KO-2023]